MKTTAMKTNQHPEGEYPCFSMTFL